MSAELDNNNDGDAVTPSAEESDQQQNDSNQNNVKKERYFSSISNLRKYIKTANGRDDRTIEANKTEHVHINSEVNTENTIDNNTDVNSENRNVMLSKFGKRTSKSSSRNKSISDINDTDRVEQSGVFKFKKYLYNITSSKEKLTANNTDSLNNEQDVQNNERQLNTNELHSNSINPEESTTHEGKQGSNSVRKTPNRLPKLPNVNVLLQRYVSKHSQDSEGVVHVNSVDTNITDTSSPVDQPVAKTTWRPRWLQRSAPKESSSATENSGNAESLANGGSVKEPTNDGNFDYMCGCFGRYPQWLQR